MAGLFEWSNFQLDAGKDFKYHVKTIKAVIKDTNL